MAHVYEISIGNAVVSAARCRDTKLEEKPWLTYIK